MRARFCVPVVYLLIAIALLTAAGCSTILGLGPEAHEDISWRDGGSGSSTDDGATPLAGQPCVFDRSKFDDGCVFGP